MSDLAGLPGVVAAHSVRPWPRRPATAGQAFDGDGHCRRVCVDGRDSDHQVETDVVLNRVAGRVADAGRGFLMAPEMKPSTFPKRPVGCEYDWCTIVQSDVSGWLAR